jgi:hypothetical protein
MTDSPHDDARLRATEAQMRHALGLRSDTPSRSKADHPMTSASGSHPQRRRFIRDGACHRHSPWSSTGCRARHQPTGRRSAGCPVRTSRHLSCHRAKALASRHRQSGYRSRPPVGLDGEAAFWRCAIVLESWRWARLVAWMNRWPIDRMNRPMFLYANQKAFVCL